MIEYPKLNRRTIILGSDLEAELRSVQADMIRNSSKQISFSKVINLLLREAIQERSKRDEVPAKESEPYVS